MSAGTTSRMTRGWTRRWALPTTERRVGDLLLDSVLKARGIEDINAFLEPSLHQMHDPASMPGLDAAAGRIGECITNDEKLMIFGDYDVDGITATTILTQTLRTLYPDWAKRCLQSYIPHRVDEGYGLNADALREFAADGVRVVVTVDCGITAVEQASIAKDLGLCLIITDHHNFDEILPDAFALVHPGLPGSAYPFRDLCGAGVAYKLAWRLCERSTDAERLPAHLRSLLVELLSFASLGTIADVVRLIDENRAIAKFGLVRIQHTPFLGLRALVHASGLDGEKIDAEDVGFKLAPRLNAVGRLGHARDALELFTTDDPAKAAAIARSLTQVNEKRRVEERAIFESACEMVEREGMQTHDKRAIVLAGDWHPGVIGIVASRLVEKFGRPTVLLSTQAELLKGSGRSLDGFSLHGALGACSQHLTRFGGHDAAAGLTLEPDQLGPFTDAFINQANSLLSPEDLAPLLDIDLVARTDELTADAVRSVEALKPFGRANPAIRMLLPGVRLVAPPETFGKQGAHLAIRIAHEGGRPLRAIAWRWGERRGDLLRDQLLDVVVRPEVSSYSGQVEPTIEDLRPESDLGSFGL